MKVMWIVIGVCALLFIFIWKMRKISRESNRARTIIKQMWAMHGDSTTEERDKRAMTALTGIYQFDETRNQYRNIYQVLLMILPEVIKRQNLRDELAGDFVEYGIDRHFITPASAKKMTLRLSNLR